MSALCPTCRGPHTDLVAEIVARPPVAYPPPAGLMIDYQPPEMYIYDPLCDLLRKPRAIQKPAESLSSAARRWMLALEVHAACDILLLLALGTSTLIHSTAWTGVCMFFGLTVVVSLCWLFVISSQYRALTDQWYGWLNYHDQDLGVVNAERERIWGMLHYCYVCDAVFLPIPERTRSVPARSMIELIDAEVLC